jgi:hypothetical protein
MGTAGTMVKSREPAHRDGNRSSRLHQGGQSEIFSDSRNVCNHSGSAEQPPAVAHVHEAIHASRLGRRALQLAAPHAKMAMSNDLPTPTKLQRISRAVCSSAFQQTPSDGA